LGLPGPAVLYTTTQITWERKRVIYKPEKERAHEAGKEEYSGGRNSLRANFRSTSLSRHRWDLGTVNTTNRMNRRREPDTPCAWGKVLEVWKGHNLRKPTATSFL